MKPLVTAAIGAVIGFGLGVLMTIFGGAWLLSYAGVGPFAEESFAAKRVREGEEKLGFACATAHQEAYRFINTEMGRLQEVTRQGKRWMAEGREEYLGRIASIRDRIQKCEVLQFEAKAGNVPFAGNFREYNRFLLSLEAFTSAVDKRAPNDREVMQVFLEDLEKGYRELAGVRTPARADAACAGEAKR